MANINGNEIFFGIVGEVEQPAAPDKLPSWFPEVNAVQDLKDHFGDDMSENYVDVAYKLKSGTYQYMYMRCYCNTADSIKIYSGNGTQMTLGYTVNGSKISYRVVGYTSDGSSKNWWSQNWDNYSTNFALVYDIDTSKICIINKGKFFNISTYNLNFQML